MLLLIVRPNIYQININMDKKSGNLKAINKIYNSRLNTFCEIRVFILKYLYKLIYLLTLIF